MLSLLFSLKTQKAYPYQILKKLTIDEAEDGNWHQNCDGSSQIGDVFIVVFVNAFLQG